MNQITEKHIGYFRGYQDARQDTMKMIAITLWEVQEKIKDLDPDLYKLIDIYLTELEKKK